MLNKISQKNFLGIVSVLTHPINLKIPSRYLTTTKLDHFCYPFFFFFFFFLNQQILNPKVKFDSIADGFLRVLADICKQVEQFYTQVSAQMVNGENI